MPYAKLNQNDEVTIPYTITEASDDVVGDGRPVDLTGSDDGDVDDADDTVTLELYFTGNDDGDPAGTVPNYDGVEVDNYVDRESGRVSHFFADDAFEYQGRYELQFIVDDGGQKQTYPKGDPVQIEVYETVNSISPGSLTDTAALSGDINADGNGFTNIGVLNFASTTNSSSEAGDLWFDGADLLLDDDGNGGDVVGSGGGGGGGADWTDGTTTVSEPGIATFTATNDASVDVIANGSDVEVAIDAQLEGDAAVLDSGGTFIAQGGGIAGEGNTAAREIVTVDNVAEDDRFQINVWPTASGSQPDDYRWSDRVSRVWDSDTDVKVEIEVFWSEVGGVDGDPGVGNDVEFAWDATDPAVAAGGSGTTLGPGSVGTTELAADSVTPSEVDSIDTPGDGEHLTYDAGTGRFRYDTGGGGGGGSVSSTPGVVVDENASVEGDGSTLTFTLPHSLGVVPAWADAVPKSKAASTDFIVQSKTDTDITIKYFAAPPDGGGSDNLLYDVITVAPATDVAQQRKEAYQQGPNISVNTAECEPAAVTSSGDPEFVESEVSIRPGWRLEVFEAGAWDDSGSVTSEARVVSATDPASDGTYTTEYTTAGVDEVPLDGGGNIDYTSTLATIDNPSGSGSPKFVFFRAVNADAGSDVARVGGAFTVVRRPIP